MPPPAPPKRRLLGLPPRIALGFGAAIVSVLVAGAFSAFALGARTRDAELVADATENALALEEVESALLVVHTSLDAWLGTGDPRHRERHRIATAKLAPAAAELQRVVGATPEGRDRVARLLAELQALREEHDDVSAHADAGERERAAALRARGAGTAAFERAKALIEELERDEAIVVEDRHVALARTLVVSNTGFLLAQGILLVLVGFAVRLVRDEIRAREEHEAARERALDVQKQLMAVVSHDLRNPLTGILAAGWALSRAGLPESEALLARRVVGAGRRMERLIRDLLDWSRVNGGAEIPISSCPADLEAVCRRVVDELGERDPGRLAVEGAGDTHAVFDPDRMEQVVANLVGNALKYAPPDSPVRVRVTGEAGEVRLEVCDEGPGIPPAAAARVFEPFERGRPVRAGEDGAGLGLFIVRTLVEAQGGTIDLETAPGRGSTFTVRLPRGAVRAPGAIRSAAAT